MDGSSKQLTDPSLSEVIDQRDKLARALDEAEWTLRMSDDPSDPSDEIESAWNVAESALVEILDASGVYLPHRDAVALIDRSGEIVFERELERLVAFCGAGDVAELLERKKLEVVAQVGSRMCAPIPAGVGSVPF